MLNHKEKIPKKKKHEKNWKSGTRNQNCGLLQILQQFEENLLQGHQTLCDVKNMTMCNWVQAFLYTLHQKGPNPETNENNSAKSASFI